MVMMECPETVNTLLHEFFLWEPDMSKKPDTTSAGTTTAATKTVTITPALESSVPTAPKANNKPPNK